MCSVWMVNGIRCESGDDLVRAVGAKAAMEVNRYYDLVGMTGWSISPSGERIEHTITDSHVLEGCLCHIDHAKIKELTGADWEYDADDDAFVASPPSKD